MKKFVLLFLLGIMAAAACGPLPTLTGAPVTVVPRVTPTQPPAPSNDLTVLAASSLTESFTALGKAFEATHPGVTVSLSFGGSQTLLTQLLNFAPADVFASADTRTMQALIDAGHTSSGKLTIFARNQLALVVPAANPAGIASLQDLANPGVKLVIAGSSVPVGNYTLKLLDNINNDPSFSSDTVKKIVQNVVSYEDNVKAVLAKVLLGEADAGIVYATDITPETRDSLKVITIPAGLNVTADYPIAVIARSPNQDLAKSFVDFVLSADGQAILAGYGFLPPE